MKDHGIIFGGMIDVGDIRHLSHPLGISFGSVKRHSGAHRIATFLRQQGLDIEVVDFAPSWSFEEFKELMKSRINRNTKFVGLGSIFHLNTNTLVTCFIWLKQTYPDVLIITGSMGFYSVNLIPADYMVVGYGELAILEILKGTAKYKEDVIDDLGNTRRTVYALHEYPAYPMRNLSIDYEKRDFLQPFESLTMETSRGCRFKCDFCNYPVLGVKSDHTRDPQDFHDNLMRNYDNYGIYRYSIADETFNDHTEKIIKYADVVEQLPFKPNFGGYIRADLLHTRPQDIEHLARMQFNGQYYGIESFHRPSAASIGKGMEPAKLQQAILNTKQYFMKHNGYYKGSISLIVGLPNETEETLNEAKKWCDENWRKEHLIYYPLTITTLDDRLRPSILSLTYEKQGYTLAEPEDLSLLTFDNPETKFMFETLLKPSDKFISWKSNTGMTQKDALMWIWKNLWTNEDTLDYGVEHWRMEEWYVYGKTDQEMLGSYRELGGFNPPIQSKIDFIEEYKTKKLNHVE